MDRLTQEALNQIIIDHRKYVKGVKGGIRAVVKFKDLSGLSMRGHDMSHADFSGCVLDNVDFSGGNFRSAAFFCCDMQGANMAAADFSNCDFRGASIINSDLSGSDLSNTDLRQGVLMSYADSDVIDSWSKDGKTRLQGSVVRNTNLSGVRAVGTNFKESNLQGARLHEADLQGSNFEGANLSSADMMGCNLIRANMADVVLDKVNLVGAIGSQAELQELIRIQNERKTIEGEQANLQYLVTEHEQWIETNGAKGTQLDLSGYDLSNQTDLRNYPLTVMIAEDSKFTGLYLAGAKMEGSILNRSDFRDCIAPEADFRGSSFRDALFTRAELKNANFGSLQVKRPDDTEITQKCDLSGSRMAYAKLDGTNFRDANLSNVDFSYASLKGCNFKGCNLEGAIFDNAEMDDDAVMTHA